MDIISIIDRFKGAKVLVIGDLILDVYIWGKVTRISPEAPVPVVDVTSNTYTLGGASNVANNIVSLGGHATVLGVMGDDPAADKSEELIKASGIDLVCVKDKRPTTVKTRVIAHSQQVVRFDHENRDKISGSALSKIIAHIKDLAPKHDAVIISDYKKGVVNHDVMQAVRKACRGRKFFAIDPKVGHYHLYKNASLITPNLSEASEGSGVEIKDEKTLIKAGAVLLKKLALKSLLITRGEAGMSLFADDKVMHIPTLAKKVFDVTGAGDTVIAVFTMAQCAGATLQQSAVIANHAAGIVVGEVGTATVNSSRLKQSVRHKMPDTTISRI